MSSNSSCKWKPLSFVEAVRKLADRAGIVLPRGGGDAPSDDERSKLHRALRFASDFYQEQLEHTKNGHAAKRYLEGRGLSGEIIRKFRLGFAPDRWDAVIRRGIREGHSVNLLEKVGLALRRGDNTAHYDRFRGRIMFPILSHTGVVLGFGGRVLVAKDGVPKYVNSPETKLYSKSRVL